MNLNQVTDTLIQQILELVQSGAPRHMTDLKWTIVLNPIQLERARIGGQAGNGPPDWLKKFKYKQTWYTHYFGGPLNCAAFCLGNWLNDGGRHNTVTVLRYGGANPVPLALAQVRELQTQFGWGVRVTMADLSAFTKVFPKYRLTLMSPNKATPEASIVVVYTGETYIEGSEKCDCYMITVNDHWALVMSLQECIKYFKNGGAYKYCALCVTVVKYNSGTTKLIKALINDWPCHNLETPERRAKLESKCEIALCEGMVHSARQTCPYYSCKSCHMGIKTGAVHRCLVLPDNIDKEHPHNKYPWSKTRYWNETEQDYDFCTDSEGDGKVPAFFAYDMETMAVQVPIVRQPRDAPLELCHPTPDENYGLDLDDLEDLGRRYLEALAETTPNLLNYDLRESVTKLVPNLVVLTNIYTGAVPKVRGDEPYRPHLVRFKGPNCIVDMIDFLRRYNKGHCYAFAHNGSGFDGKFIFDAVTKINGLQQTPILRGTNFVSLKVHLAQGGNTTYFYDSMLHLPGSLANLLRGFFANSPDRRLQGGKGHFPHKFNTEENQNYVGPIPVKGMFSPQQLPMGAGKDKWKALNAFEEWYDSQQGLVWDFQKEFVDYCDMDVIGLAALLKVYMEISIPKGGIPLMKTTAPSFVHQLYLQRVVKGLVLPEVGYYALQKQIKEAQPELKGEALKQKINSVKAENTRRFAAEIEERSETGWSVLKPPEYNFVRRSLRGGRTVTTDSLMTLSDEERDAGIRILYQDVTSLYPAEQMTRKFPCGVPTIHFYTWGFKPCHHCENFKDDAGEYIMECDCPLVPEMFDGVAGKKKGYPVDTSVVLTQVDSRNVQPTAESFLNDPEMFGYVCCDLTPPKNLFHPVRISTNL